MIKLFTRKICMKEHRPNYNTNKHKHKHKLIYFKTSKWK